jgi:hypothetical protein
MSHRLKFFRDWGLSFAAAISAVSGFIAVIPSLSLTIFRSSVIFVSCLLASGTYAWQRTRSRQLPTDEFISAEIKLHCILQSPPSHRLAEAANRLANETFGTAGGIPAERYESWRLKNPNILACLTDFRGVLLGYFDVFPLTSSFMDRFIRGDATELDISHEDILPPPDARRCKRLYIGGITVRDPQTFAGRRYARHLMWGLVKYLEHFYGAPSERQVYALGSTKAGRLILERFGFRMVQDGSRRRDGQPLFVTSLGDPEMVSDSYADIGDWAPACRLSWLEQSPGRGQQSVS